MGNFSHFPHPAVLSFMLYAQCDVKTRRTFFFPLLSGGKYQLALCEQWVIHLAQDQGNCHLKTFHSPIILQLRSLRVQMDRRRKMPLWALTHRTSPTAWVAWLCQLSLSPLCLAHAQMFDLRMISSCFSARIWVLSPLPQLGTSSEMETNFNNHNKKNIFRTVNVAEATMTGFCT